LEYYCRASQHGELLDTIGHTETDLPAAATLITQEAARLGEILGLEEVVSISGFDDGKKCSIQEHHTEIELVIVSKQASVPQIISQIRALK
jgi:hypothetical protein